MKPVSRRTLALSWAADLVVACKSTDVMEGASLIDKALSDCASEKEQEILEGTFSAVFRSAQHPNFVPFESWSSLLAGALSLAAWVMRADGPDDTEGTEVTEPSPPKPSPGLVAGITLGELLRCGAFDLESISPGTGLRKGLSADLAEGALFRVTCELEAAQLFAALAVPRAVG